MGSGHANATYNEGPQRSIIVLSGCVLEAHKRLVLCTPVTALHGLSAGVQHGQVDQEHISVYGPEALAGCLKRCMAPLADIQHGQPGAHPALESKGGRAGPAAMRMGWLGRQHNVSFGVP
eukprot:1151426-Pelagomonas_calceolata.AAC.11